MANISFFYPDRMKGWALGLNAAGGNIGVSTVQLLVPILMGFGFISLYQASPTAGVYLQNAGLMWLVPLAIAVTGAVLFMNNLSSARSTFKDQLVIVRRKHTWIMSYIYIGTFRILHRLLGRISITDQDAISDGHDRHCFPGPPGWLSRASARWLACR